MRAKGVNGRMTPNRKKRQYLWQTIHPQRVAIQMKPTPFIRWTALCVRMANTTTCTINVTACLFCQYHTAIVVAAARLLVITVHVPGWLWPCLPSIQTRHRYADSKMWGTQLWRWSSLKHNHISLQRWKSQLIWATVKTRSGDDDNDDDATINNSCRCGSRETVSPLWIILNWLVVCLRHRVLACVLVGIPIFINTVYLDSSHSSVRKWYEYQ
jgi:hypothetical protein